MYREAIRRTMARHVGGTPDASAVAEATLRTWHQMVAQLAPVLGARGVDALFNRSLQLTSATFPWLASAQSDRPGVAPLAGLKALLETRDSTAATEACHALLVTFTELLASLIGEPLTERLLSPIWVFSPAASESGNTP